MLVPQPAFLRRFLLFLSLLCDILTTLESVLVFPIVPSGGSIANLRTHSNCCLLEGGGGSNESVPEGRFPLGSVLYKSQKFCFFNSQCNNCFASFWIQPYGHFSSLCSRIGLRPSATMEETLALHIGV